LVPTRVSACISVTVLLPVRTLCARVRVYVCACACACVLACLSACVPATAPPQAPLRAPSAALAERPPLPPTAARCRTWPCPPFRVVSPCLQLARPQCYHLRPRRLTFSRMHPSLHHLKTRRSVARLVARLAGRRARLQRPKPCAACLSWGRQRRAPRPPLRARLRFGCARVVGVWGSKHGSGMGGCGGGERTRSWLRSRFKGFLRTRRRRRRRRRRLGLLLPAALALPGGWGGT